MPDLMIDLNTLSDRPDGVFTQIGVTIFEPRGDKLLSHFVLRLSPQDAIDRGRHVAWDSLCWWNAQDVAPRDGVFQPGGLKLPGGLQSLNQRLVGHGVFKSVWSYGASRDIPMLEHAYETCGVMVPWEYKQHRCLRTLASMYPDVERVQAVTPHNAGLTSIAQALWAQKLLAAAAPKPDEQQGAS